MVTVDGDCRVNKSNENKWLDWRGKERGEGGRLGIEERPVALLNWREWTCMRTKSAEAGRGRINEC